MGYYGLHAQTYLTSLFLERVGISISPIGTICHMNKKAKNQESNINQKLKLVIQSGKYKIGKFSLSSNSFQGYRNTIRSLRSGQSKLILIASNCPAIRRTELEYYAVLAKSDVHHFDGNNVELGTACAKLFPVSAMIISDPGDSDILESV